MNPFFFGDSASQLFGAYDPPAGRSTRGVVICNPLAREYLLAYPTMRHLALQLAEGGLHVLRFDYYGTGDSAGDMSGASRSRWLGDIEAAVQELRDTAQVTSVSLVGMRFGAALAAEAAARISDLSSLVLWDPVYDGARYLAEAGVVPARLRNGNDIEVQGVVLGQALRRDVEAVTPELFGARLPRTLVVSTAPAPGAARPLTDRLAAGGVEWSEAHVPDVQVWREEWGRGGIGMAVEAARRVVEWLR